ncbi:hypothetical protein BS50DRAFT_592706 [Corynespora cassiicola Philippines]|uniref:Uncharacterized protein n=1 Tax=Corynespora cassiicola Philippines TaxID=1448308 RepID=A0A2T2N949_CORCC|nr:hypothetical protein BS50DRAFT_592706 [Corynespora cassiicola Philippines]
MSFKSQFRREDETNFEYGVIGTPKEAPATKDAPDGSHLASRGTVQPHKLENHKIFKILVDSLLMLLPAAFFNSQYSWSLVLAVSAYALDEKPISRRGDLIEQAMQLGPTIYPLIYVAIGARCLRKIAVFLAERGTRVGTLEKLLGSQSFVSSVFTATALRSLNWMSILILVFWMLSPLGGQSSLRLLYRHNTTIPHLGSAFYSSPEAPYNPDYMWNTNWDTPIILSASLAMDNENLSRPVDMFNYPKIPRVRELELEPEPEEGAPSRWYDISHEPGTSYSSWTGIAIRGLEKQRDAQFTVRYNYVTLDCALRYRDPEVTNLLKSFATAEISPWNEPHNPQSVNCQKNCKDMLFTNQVFHADEDRATLDRSILKYGFNRTAPQNTTFMTTTAYESGLEKDKRGSVFILYGLFSIYSTQMYAWECNPKTINLDAQIDCQDGNCRATQLRRTRFRSTMENGDTCDATNATTTSCLYGGRIYQLFERYATATAPHLYSHGESVFQIYLRGGDPYSGKWQESIFEQDKVPAELISKRLTVLLNTYRQADTWHMRPMRANVYAPPENISSEWRDQPLYMNETSALFTYKVPIYKADLRWVLALVFTTSVLLILSLVNIVISYKTLAPDIFGPVSSLTRENPYTDAPKEGTWMGDFERSRLLRRLMVQIADVKPGDKVGYLALRSVAHKEEFADGRLARERLYA